MIKEATELMNKMKDMPGMGNIQSMLSKMGMGGLGGGGGGKVNTAAMEAQLNQRLKMAKMKERIRAKAEANAKTKAEAELLNASKMNNPQNNTIVNEEELVKLFSSEEKIERTPRGANPQQKTNNKKKKGKK